MSNPKTVKLIRRCGKCAPLNLIQLWLSAAESRPLGRLTKWDAEDVAIASGWESDPDTWVKCLIEIGFVDLIEEEDCSYQLHDWERHNPFVFHAEERSEQARNAAKKRWGKRIDAVSNAVSISEQCDTQENSNAPYPNPNPNPKHKEGPSAEPTTKYAFDGKVIRLTERDHDRWKKSFSNINLDSVLESRDAWLSEQPAADRKKWFQTTAAYLANKDTEALASKPPAYDGEQPEGFIPQKPGFYYGKEWIYDPNIQKIRPVKRPGERPILLV